MLAGRLFSLSVWLYRQRLALLGWGIIGRYAHSKRDDADQRDIHRLAS